MFDFKACILLYLYILCLLLPFMIVTWNDEPQSIKLKQEQMNLDLWSGEKTIKVQSDLYFAMNGHKTQ